MSVVRFHPSQPDLEVSVQPKQIGNISEAKILARALELGYEVALPFGENCRYDMILDDRKELTRIQVKTGRLADGVVTFVTCSNNSQGAARGVRKEYTSEEIDAFAVFCPELEQCFLVPVTIGLTRMASLRVTEARNNQKQGIRLAKDFEF